MNGRQNLSTNLCYFKLDGKYVPNTSVYVADGSIGFWAYSDFRRAGLLCRTLLPGKLEQSARQIFFSSLLQKYKFIKGVKAYRFV